jgi:hypothetical protein
MTAVAGQNGVMELLSEVWAAVGGGAAALDAVVMDEPHPVLPSAFDVTGLAAATTAAAGLAAASALAARTRGNLRTVTVDHRAAAASFLSERLLTPVGWTRPEMWDPIAGDYRAADGWIRLHTNYAHHRAAVERVLGTEDAIRATLEERVREWPADELEAAVVAAGGCAAAMHPRTPNAEPLARIERTPTAQPRPSSTVDSPYEGIRVLDLTRVIAGPVATRTLAAFGARVLRLDPPGFAEVPALLPDVTVGKRCAALDLRSAAETFDGLLADTDVLVCGLRPGALDALGYDEDRLRQRRPDLILASLDAYGWDGPWQGRRGFDSLVQMSCGIAATGAELSGVDRPVPLPAQALDHGTGYLLAAAIGVALARRHTHGEVTTIRASLAGTANALMVRPTPGDLSLDPPTWTDDDTVPGATAWGPVRRVPLPVHVDGARGEWTIDAGPLGRDPARWY